MNTAFQLLHAKDYVADAARTVRRAKHRVYLMTLVLIDEDQTHDLLEAIRDAAKRGVDVVVAADYFTVTEHGGFSAIRLVKNRVLGARRLEQSFEHAGGRFEWLGRDSMSLYSGRTHSKWLVVDDICYSFGGVNLYNLGVESTDYMLKKTDPVVADQLAYEQLRIMTASRRRHAYRSHSLTIPTGRILIDGGFVGDSVIYRRACSLVAQAKSVVYVSQFAPNGRLGRRLKRGGASLYFNPWQQADGFNGRLFIRLSAFLAGHKTLYRKKQFLHAKFLLCTMPDGRKVVLTGSHNFANGGIWLGTREIALESSDPALVNQIEQFFQREIA